MPKPLQFGDPGELGPFRLDSRLAESPAGIVYLGSDPSGRPVEVALLTTSAAGDAAARDRFRAAVSAEKPRPGVAAGGEGSPVLASLTEGAAPWVATAYEEGRSGAERFLEPVLLKRGWGVRRHRGGPQFQPYWLSGPRGPALQPVEPAGVSVVAGDTKGLATAVISLAALLVLLAVLVLLLFSCEPSDPKPPQPTQPPPVSTQPFPQPPPPSPSVRPTPSKSGSRTPRPTESGGQSTENPAGMP
jgi:hypothetical protein